MTSQQRRKYIETARMLVRELRFAASRFDELALRDLNRREFWAAMQLDAELVAGFRTFLEKLWFDGIRSRFFANFDASKLILPLASTVADRLDALVEELEMQADACGDGAPSRHAVAVECRIEN